MVLGMRMTVKVGGELEWRVWVCALDAVGLCRMEIEKKIVHAVQGVPSVFGWMGVRLSVWIISCQIVNDFMEETG
jgi:hypothetical protein